jgi:hypothetical protein
MGWLKVALALYAVSVPIPQMAVRVELGILPSLWPSAERPNGTEEKINRP